MTDVHDIIYYFKSLKRGFDKNLFQSKIDELVYVVDTNGLVYEDFHTLFKVWLNLSIPITKWVNLGLCLVPADSVEEQTVEYALRWILANLDNQPNYTRVGFLLDWLTAAMESDSIDMVSLDYGYEIFYTMLTFEALTVHALKLVYTLTKPVDVTRRRVLELLEYAKKREAKKNMFRQLQVLLGLFKSYKPECVPEDVPATSIHASFKKLNVSLLARFKRNQELRNRLSKERHHLLWTNPLNSDRGRNKKADPLVPNVHMLHNQESNFNGKELPKSPLDFSDPVSLVQYSLHYTISRPARLRALLCNAAGHTLLAVTSHHQQAFLSHDLHHLLHSCFLDVSPHSYIEKQDLLQRLAVFQRTVMQGIPVVTTFLAQYLPLWNERDYFFEILALVEWVSIFCPEHIQCIVDCLSRVYHRAQPIQQCAMLRTLTAMYTNLVYASNKTRYHFLNMVPSQTNYMLVLPELAAKISDLCNKELQVNPDELRVLYSTIWSAERRATAELSHGLSIGALPSPLTLALPLLSVSATLVDNMAALMILYKKIISASKKKNEKQIETLSNYMSDVLNCLYSEEVLAARRGGLVFQRMHPQLVDKLVSIIPDVDRKLSLRNNLAFAPYTYMEVTAIDYRDADNKIWFNAVIEQEFPNLGRFLKTALPELRCQ